MDRRTRADRERRKKEKRKGNRKEKKAGRSTGRRIRNRAERPTSILKDRIDISGLASTHSENQ